MKRIKKLKWENLVNPVNEKQGFVYLKSLSPLAMLSYHIASKSGKLYFEPAWEQMIEVKDIEEGKRLAQQHFEKYVMDTFFEKPIPFREIYYIIYDKKTFKIFDVPRFRSKETDKLLKDNQNLECINITHPMHKELLKTINEINKTNYK